MAFELKADEPITKGIRRTLRRELKKADRQLAALSAEGAVHDLRKRLKRVRALARLFAERIGDKAFRQFDKVARNASRRLARWRDAEVLVATVDKLRSDDGAREHHDEVDALHARFLAKRNEAIGDLLAHDEAAKKIAVDLKTARRHVKRWRLSQGGRRVIAEGLAATYAAARQAWETAAADASIENLHQWRKQTKALWNQMQFLRPLRPRVFGPIVEQLHSLADLLGDDHDLGVLGQTILASADATDGRTLADFVNQTVHRERTRLEQQAFVLGREFFQASPKDFTAHLRLVRQGKENVG